VKLWGVKLMDVGRCLWNCSYWGVRIRRVADLHSLVCDPVETPVRPHLQPLLQQAAKPDPAWTDLNWKVGPFDIHPKETKNKKFQVVRGKKNPKSTQFLCGKMKNDVVLGGGWKKNTRLSLVGPGQSESTATNAPVGRSVHWMGCVFSFGAGWGSTQSISFCCWPLYFFFFFFCSWPFFLDLTSHVTTLLTFLASYVLHQPWYLIYYSLLTQLP
jgi:hypothetical protein